MPPAAFHNKIGCNEWLVVEGCYRRGVIDANKEQGSPVNETLLKHARGSRPAACLHPRREEKPRKALKMIFITHQALEGM